MTSKETQWGQGEIKLQHRRIRTHGKHHRRFVQRRGAGLGKVFDGHVISGLGDVLVGVGGGVGRTVNGALNLFGLGEEDIPPGLLYMLGVVGLLAKMAKADGHVDKTEIKLMQDLFKAWELDRDALKKFQKAFNDFKDDATKIAELAEAVTAASVQMSPADEGLDLRIDAYRYLFLMALADENLDDSEIVILRTIPSALGLKDEVFEWMASELLGDGPQGNANAALEEAYRVLGVNADASDAEVNNAYRRKIAKFHPDKILGKQLDSEWVEIANEKSAEINEAYNIIRNARQLGQSIQASAPAECDADGLVYDCPHCGMRFSVSEDSEEYLVPCPECGNQLDLTELNPL